MEEDEKNNQSDEVFQISFDKLYEIQPDERVTLISDRGATKEYRVLSVSDNDMIILGPCQMRPPAKAPK